MTPVLIVAVALLAALDTLKQSPAEVVEASARKIKELQKERIAILKEAAEGSFQLAKRGRSVSIREASEVRMTLLKAELAAAEKESDRITIYKEALAAMKLYVEVANAAFAAARANNVDRLMIKAHCLEIEMGLEQAQIQAAKALGH